MPRPLLDHDTAETLRNLVRLGRWDDERIARYCAVDVEYVRAARGAVKPGRTRRPIPEPKGGGGVPAGQDQWSRACRRSSAALAEAILRAQLDS
jgi:hypothetical protein